LESNDLSGSIPPELGNLSNITHLTLSGNQLTGSIPPALGNLTTLELLQLHSNQLTGPIPAEMGNLTALEYLAIDSNQLDGVVPLAVAQLGGAIQAAKGVGYCTFWPGNPGLSLLDNPDYRAADQDTDGFICGVPFPGPALVAPWPFF
jgi:hypothetical protein